MGTKKQEDPGLLARLSRPTGPVDVVLDTDTIMKSTISSLFRI